MVVVLLKKILFLYYLCIDLAWFKQSQWWWASNRGICKARKIILKNFKALVLISNMHVSHACHEYMEQVWSMLARAVCVSMSASTEKNKADAVQYSEEEEFPKFLVTPIRILTLDPLHGSPSTWAASVSGGYIFWRFSENSNHFLVWKKN